VHADSVLVVDAGTSAMRAVVVRADGSPTALGRQPWRMFVPADASPFARELAPADVAGSMRLLIAQAAPIDGRLAGIAVTGQREGIVFLDAEDAALFASPNVDGRAFAEGMAMDAGHGERVYTVTGHLPSLMQAPAKLAWLREHRPAVAERVRRVLPLADWLAMLLTGEGAMSRSLAAENGLLDVSTGSPALPLLRLLGVPDDLLARVAADGAIVGTVRHGMSVGLPVVLAGADTQCALAGMGAVEDGAGVVAGWSAPVQLVVRAPILDAQSRIWTGLHATPARWVLESNAGECGRTWDWVCAMMSLSSEEAEGLAEASPPGARDALAVLGSRVMRASKMNAGIGALTVPLPLIMSAPERGDVLRSVLESLAFAVRANVEQLEEVSGARIPRLALGGGMSRSPLLARILADVIDRPVDVARAPETSALGAAAVASPALSLHDTIESAAEAMARPMRVVEPDVLVSSVYEDGYGRWCEMADQLESGMA
jgi:autoinducer 2 (AI-2) kinase